MYMKLLSIEEQEQMVRALTGWQFLRDRHGSLYDRGAADSYYNRSPDAHYGGVGGDSGPRVAVTDAKSVAEYMAGYDFNERFGDKKDWR
jgi:hypothetical protein